MNFGKYSVVDSLEHHFELEPEWYWRIRPATSGDDLVMAKYYVENSRSVFIDGKRVEQPPLWMEVMYREIAQLFDGTNIPKDPKKPNAPVLDNSSSTILVAPLTISIFSGVTSPITLATKAGPGKGGLLYISSGNPTAFATSLTPVFLS